MIAAEQQQNDSITAYGICRLNLSAFRSYSNLNLNCGVSSVILIGPNGAGKTNILEAISLLTPGRGFRQATSSEIINLNISDRPWAVSVALQSSKGMTQIGVGIDPESFIKGRERRVVRVDGNNVRSQADLNDYIHVLWLTPTMDRLFQGPPADRRRFLDRLVYGLQSDHAIKVKSYEHATQERLKLLKQGIQNDAWLSALENQMAKDGVAIAVERERMVRLLTEQIQQSSTPFPKAKLGISGWVDDLLKSGLDELEAENSFRNKLAENRLTDGLVGMTRAGPHRSDLTCVFMDKSISADQCSTGEQKAMLLSITLAAVRLQALKCKGAPILLLDEVVAHLDPIRRRDLFDEIENLRLQTWMTGTDLDLFAGFSNQGQYFYVENSIVSAKNVL